MTATLPAFPVDPDTLDRLDAALTIQPGADRTTLTDLCDAYTQAAGVGPGVAYDPADVIRSLVTEVRRLREETP